VTKHFLRLTVTAAETELVKLKDELANELVAMTRLHELSNRMMRDAELKPLLEEVLNATMAFQKADFGLVQLFNPETMALEIVAQLREEAASIRTP